MPAKPSLSSRCSAVGLIALLMSGASSAHARPKNKRSAPAPEPAAASGQEPEAAHAAPEPEPPAPAQPVAAPPPVPPTAAKPQPTPAKQDAPEAAQANVAASEKLAMLRADVTSLMDDLVEARSRSAMLGKTLFKTQVRVRVQNLASPDPVLVKIVLKLDGAPIYRGDAAALSGDDAHQVFQSFIAPGAHVLSAEIEQRSRDDAAYGYTLHESYRFQALREKRSDLTLILDDDSDLAGDFPDDGAGEYDVRTKLRVKSKNLNDE